MEPITMTTATLIKLLPTVASALDAFGKTEAGKLVFDEGKRVMEVAIPLVKKASQISINFLATNIGGDSHSNSKSIQLSKPLDIVENSLSLPKSYNENLYNDYCHKIMADLDVIKGQNEILFLSNSINYFLESHKTRTGIDRGISYALQYDITAVCNYLQKQRDLRFPGYLLHQFASLAETIKDLNVFYVSILNEGIVPEYNEQEVKDDFLKGFGIDKRKGEISSYVPHEMLRRIIRENPPLQTDKEKAGSLLGALKGRILTKDIEEDVNDIAHDTLFILKEELVSNEELEYQIVKRLKMQPDNKIIVQS